MWRKMFAPRISTLLLLLHILLLLLSLVLHIIIIVIINIIYNHIYPYIININITSTLIGASFGTISIGLIFCGELGINPLGQGRSNSAHALYDTPKRFRMRRNISENSTMLL